MSCRDASEEVPQLPPGSLGALTLSSSSSILPLGIPAHPESPKSPQEATCSIDSPGSAQPLNLPISNARLDERRRSQIILDPSSLS